MAAVWVGYAHHVLPMPDAQPKAPSKERPAYEHSSTPPDMPSPPHRPEVSPAAQEQLLHMVLAGLRLTTRLQEPFVGGGASPAREAVPACRRLTLTNSPGSSAGLYHTVC